MKHAYIAVGVIWIVSIFSTAVSFLKYFITLIIAYTVISLYLVISAYCYINIYLTLREHRSQAHCIRVLQQSPAVPLNIATYRKTLSGCVWLQQAVVICCLPNTDNFVFRKFQHSSFLMDIPTEMFRSSISPLLIPTSYRTIVMRRTLYSSFISPKMWIRAKLHANPVMAKVALNELIRRWLRRIWKQFCRRNWKGLFFLVEAITLSNKCEGRDGFFFLYTVISFTSFILKRHTDDIEASDQLNKPLVKLDHFWVLQVLIFNVRLGANPSLRKWVVFAWE